MKSKDKKNEAPTNFPDIKTVEGLKLYLDDTANRLRNSPYLYHYTTVSNVIKMIQGKTWHLGNAAGMNDNLEYKNGDPLRWNNLFFSCFMCEDKESIGMWSMYAQPWEKGVKVALPRKVVREWIEDTKEILEISTTNYQPTGRAIAIEESGASLKLSSVAYCNADSLQETKANEKVMWSTAINTNIKNAVRIPELTGYIKDMAWSYEKEIRIKAEFENIRNIKRVAIPLTDEVIDAMTITASPLFEGDLHAELEREIARQVKTEESIFIHRLNIKTICQGCEYKLA